jgi:hypothetical protein
MKKIIKILATIIFLIFYTLEIRAQIKKLGDISSLEFSSHNTKYDSTMPAIILFEYGYADFDSDVSAYLNYHKRMLILNDEGLEYANVEIPINKEFKQEVFEIKASSYRLSESGAISETKLNRKEIITEKFNDDITLKKFSIPGVNSGTILEYSYRKKMGNPFMLPDWEFHDYLPVQWSEYKMQIPVGLQYKMIFKGNDSLEVYEVNKSLVSTVSNRNQGSYIFRMVKKDLPPVEDLPYMINRDDYISEVITQLQNISLPNYRFQNFFKDWDALAKELNDRGDFGKQRLNGEMKEVVDNLISGKITELEKARSIYQYVVSNLEWDGMHRILTEKGIRDAFNTNIGNTGDINHLLIEMLRYADIKASPGLLSTRSNGSVLTDFALINQFNMVLAVVEIENRAFVMDASSGNRSFKSPHPKILYRKVFVIREDDSFGWLQSTPMDKNNERISLTYSVSESPTVNVKYQGRLMGEFAERLRSEVNLSELDEYWENEFDDIQGIRVDSSSFDNLENMGEQISFQTSLSIPSESVFDVNGNLIYLKPFLFLALQENPFKAEDREFPIEINYPYKRQYVTSLTIPEGYVIEEIPKNTQIRLPNNTGYYRFMVSQQGDKLTLVSDINIASTYYGVDDYSMVKDLFQKVVDSQSFTVVLEKIKSE